MSSPLLEVKDLQVVVGEENKVLLDGLNLTVNAGETHVLMGHNGAGKSTLMSALMGDPRYTVTGTMTGGTGAGGHMWNVVQLENKNLLVDVTNCDGSAIGAPDKLFLVAVAGTDSGRTHTFTIGSTNVVYTYDESQKDLFCSGYLALTPDSSSEKGSIKLKVTSYDTADSTLISLYQNGTRIEIAGYPGEQTGQLKTSVMEVRNVTPGVYDLVVSKSGCLDYTIKNVVVTSEGVDLTSHSDPAIKNIKLLCGDVNGDGTINSVDLNTVWQSTNYLKSVGDSGVAAITDINGDGTINSLDLNIIWSSENYLKSTANCTFND